MLGAAANHVIGIDALMFPELFAAHAAHRVLADSVASLLRWQRDEALAATGVPVSLLYAARAQRPRQVRELQSRYSITPLASGGHFFFMEYPAETATAIKAADRAAQRHGTRQSLRVIKDQASW
jgi:hypothetical protein